MALILSSVLHAGFGCAPSSSSPDGHRLHATTKTSNCRLGSKSDSGSDQPTGVLRAPAKPMVQPQLVAPSAEPALKIIHDDSDWMQDCDPQGLRLVTLGWIMPVHVCPSRASLSHDSSRVIGPTRFFGSHRGAPWLLKPDSVVNQGSVRQAAILGKGVVRVCFHCH